MVLADEEIARAFVAAARHRLAKSATKIKHCLAQLTDEQLWWRPQPAPAGEHFDGTERAADLLSRLASANGRSTNERPAA